MTEPIQFIDLFCGLGAFHTAFAGPEFKCVLACDIDEGVRNIYEANYGIIPKSDIRDLKDIPQFDILCAGFPCQPFSIAGNGEGFSDLEKGNLFYEILRIIDEHNPPLCILENVKNLKTHDGGRTYSTIQKELESRGYIVTSKVLNAVDYGSPQARQRIFIVASKKSFTIPDGLGEIVLVSSILDSECTDAWYSENHELVEKTSKLKKGNPHSLYDIVSKKSGKGGRQGERVYSTDSVGVTVCASSGGPGAKTGLYQVGDSIRRLNLKETLRMFGFSDNYKFGNTPTEKCLFYLGNSIVVNVAAAFVPEVIRYFKECE
jgi:DNA (cytosine-5)-methyltransferase 1